MRVDPVVVEPFRVAPEMMVYFESRSPLLKSRQKMTLLTRLHWQIHMSLK